MCIHIHASCGTSKLQYCDCSESQLCLPCIFPLRLKGIFTYNFLDCTFLLYDFFLSTSSQRKWNAGFFPHTLSEWKTCMNSCFTSFTFPQRRPQTCNESWHFVFLLCITFPSWWSKMSWTYLKISMPGFCCEISGEIIFSLHCWVVFPYRGLGCGPLCSPASLRNWLSLYMCSLPDFPPAILVIQILRHTWNWISPCSLHAL